MGTALQPSTQPTRRFIPRLWFGWQGIFTELQLQSSLKRTEKHVVFHDESTNGEKWLVWVPYEFMSITTNLSGKTK